MEDQMIGQLKVCQCINMKGARSIMRFMIKCRMSQRCIYTTLLSMLLCKNSLMQKKIFPKQMTKATAKTKVNCGLKQIFLYSVICTREIYRFNSAYCAFFVSKHIKIWQIPMSHIYLSPFKHNTVGVNARRGRTVSGTENNRGKNYPVSSKCGQRMATKPIHLAMIVKRLNITSDTLNNSRMVA